MKNDARRGLVELEAWLASLDPPRLPTEAEIDFMDWWLDVAALEEQARETVHQPPEGGDALGLFADEA